MTAPATIVVASYGRPRQIRDCLARLCALDHPDLRIIVVDDGSPAPIAPIAAPFGDRVRVLRQDNAGPAAARNRGVEAAETDFVAFTDDDCWPEPDWLVRLQAVHEAQPEALVGGKIVNALTNDLCAAASQGVSEYLYDWYQAGAGFSPFFTTNNLGFSRQTFLELGGLDSGFVFASEDRDLGMRWRASGRPLVYAADAVVGHRHAMTLTGFWRQHASYGRGARRLHLKMDRRGDARPKVEPFRFYWGLLVHPLRREGRAPLPAALAQSALVALSQVAMVRGYAAEIADERAARRRPPPAAKTGEEDRP